MIEHLLALVSHFVIGAISHLGYAGVLGLMAIESACIPLPSEIILPFSGFLVSTGRFTLLGVTLAAALGCNVGSAVAYGVGYAGGRPLAERYGRWVWLAPKDLEMAERWFARHGDVTVLVARLLPIVRTFIALPAGIARMPFWRFNLYTFLGSLPWCFVLAWAGLRLGENWPRLHKSFHRFDTAFAAVLLVAVVWFLWRHWKASRQPA